jgi:hypothetical protein
MPKIPTAALAKHWAVTPARVRQLRMVEGDSKLPEFEDLGQVLEDDGITMRDHPERWIQADTWRRIHAPPRKKSAAAVAAAPVSDVPDAASTGKPGGEGGAAPKDGDAVDVSRFLVPVEDFDGEVIRQTEDAVKVQWGLYLEACKGGNSARIAAAFDNWQNAARRCREIRDAFVKMRERAANFLTVDRAADIVGRELGVLQALLVDFDAKAFPEAPVEDVRRSAVRAAMDEVLARMEAAGDALEAAAAERAA